MNQINLLQPTFGTLDLTRENILKVIEEKAVKV
jgi:hypothetical protein